MRPRATLGPLRDSPIMLARRTALPDRDGVLNREPVDGRQVRSPAASEPPPATLRAFRRSESIASHLTVVTNRRGVACGLPAARAPAEPPRESIR